MEPDHDFGRDRSGAAVRDARQPDIERDVVAGHVSVRRHVVLHVQRGLLVDALGQSAQRSRDPPGAGAVGHRRIGMDQDRVGGFGGEVPAELGADVGMQRIVSDRLIGDGAVLQPVRIVDVRVDGPRIVRVAAGRARYRVRHTLVFSPRRPQLLHNREKILDPRAGYPVVHVDFRAWTAKLVDRQHKWKSPGY